MGDTSAEAVTLDAATCLLLDGRFVQEADYRKATARIAELETELLETQDHANAFATKEYYTEMRAERAEAEVARLRGAIHKVEAALADIAEGEPDPDNTAEKIWCKDRAAEGLFIARVALQEGR